MLSRSYPQISQSVQAQGFALEGERAPASDQPIPALGRRAQAWLAFATVLAASWGTWSFASWLLAHWQLR